MGIPGLTARLLAYATPIKWVKRTGSEEPQGFVVIDGPALAYYIYYQCLANQVSAGNAFEAFPSYEQVSSTVLLWLEQIESFGLAIQRIYFDGFLPKTKSETRLERLQSYLNQLRTFRSTHLEPGPAAGSHGRRRRDSVSSPNIARSSANPPHPRLSALPALPFLVPIVIDALRGSEYAEATQMVLGEADTAAADEVNRTIDGIVLTSDSDLLVHCPTRRVLFFNDFIINDEAIHARHYITSDIARSFNCDDFHDIAYIMAEHKHISASQAARKFKADETLVKRAALKWRASAQHDDQLKDVASLKPLQERRVQQVLASADPRTSEMLCSSIIQRSNHQNDTAVPRVEMYLPFLIDDPMRASAWRASGYIRSVAYSLLRASGPNLEFFEIDRRGPCIRENAVELHSHAQLQREQDLLRERLAPRGAEPLPADLDSRRSMWLRTGVRMTIQAQQNGAAPPAPLESVLGVISSADACVSWEAVHFKAQVEGLLYSLRILHAVLMCLSMDLPSSKVSATGNLIGALATFPSLKEFVSSPNKNYSLNDASRRSVRAEVLALYGKSEEELQQEESAAIAGFRPAQSKKQLKRKRKKTEEQRDERQADPHNMYSILTDS